MKKFAEWYTEKTKLEIHQVHLSFDESVKKAFEAGQSSVTLQDWIEKIVKASAKETIMFDDCRILVIDSQGLTPQELAERLSE